MTYDMKKNNTTRIVIKESWLRNAIRYALNETVSNQSDQEYMSAVQAGDMEKAAAMVRDAFKRAYPDTKVVDKSGNPLIVYHGSRNLFTQFKEIGCVNVGQYFTDDPKVAAEYSDGDQKVRLKPIKSAEEAVDYLNKTAGANTYNYTLTRKRDDNTISIDYIDKDYDEEEPVNLFTGPEEDFIADIKQYVDMSGRYDIMLNMVNPLIIDNKGRSWQEINAREIFGGDDDFFISTNQLMAVFNRDQYDGHDGVIIKNIRDGADVVSNEFITIDPGQIKSAEPVTYDNEGNIIPLSQRFTNNKDIRYEEE